MHTYIALLRAVNVGGRTVHMETLRDALTELGLARVRTYIQSGNVFFDYAKRDRAALTRSLEACLKDTFGFEIPVFLRTIPELEAIVDADPFRGVRVTDDDRLSVIFLPSRPPKTLSLPMRSPKGDFELIGAGDAEIFAVWHLVNGRPPNPGVFLEKTLSVPTTARFFATTAKILEAARS